jgi:hypothetical protein
MIKLKDLLTEDSRVDGKIIKAQGNLLRAVFGKTVQLTRSVNQPGKQQQVWWDVENMAASPSGAGATRSQMAGKFQQWQRNKLSRLKKGTAANSLLHGWQPVFQNSDTGLRLVMVKGK